MVKLGETKSGQVMPRKVKLEPVKIGQVKIGQNLTVEPHHTVLFTREGEAVQIENVSEQEAQLILISGKPLGSTSQISQ